ncbi:MAG: polyphosphate polymerase domain-containing protein [Candidatus Pelethousia sp.]|nr:polyphosphate polymerase domain-containing protein [Candidatus Pelethousia sp.]
MKVQKNHASDIFRHEVKYYISEREAYMLSQYLRLIMRVDRHAGVDGQYWIRSLYFDTLGNRDYFDKVNGYSERRKLRLRIYDADSDTAMLELKSKRGAFVHKESMQLNSTEAIGLINDNCAFLPGLPNDAAGKFYTCFRQEHLRPVLLIDYERQAFELPFENIRITIDRNLRASLDASRLFDKSVPCINVMNEARCILEVKYRYAIPNFLRSVLSNIGLPSTSVSKYVISRQSIHF